MKRVLPILAVALILGGCGSPAATATATVASAPTATHAAAATTVAATAAPTLTPTTAPAPTATTAPKTSAYGVDTSIAGVWVDADKTGYIEFTGDKAFFRFGSNSKDAFTVTYNWRWLDLHTISFSMGGLSEARKVVIEGDKMQMTLPDGAIETYDRVK